MVVMGPLLFLSVIATVPLVASLTSVFSSVMSAHDASD